MEIFLQQAINLIQLGSIYALLAIGFSIVYGIVRLVNFAHGDIFMVATYAFFFLATWLLSSIPSLYVVLIITLVLVAIAVSILAVGIERVAYKPLRSAPKVSVVVTSLAVGLLLQHLVLQFIGPTPQRVPRLVPDMQFQFGGVYVELYQFVIIAVALFIMLLLSLFIMKTKTGIAMRAAAQDATAASLMGISNDFIISIAFVVGATVASIGAGLYGMAYPIFDPYIGQMINWWSFTAAVLGGIGDIKGAVLGGFLLAAVMVITPMFLPVSSYRDIVAFGILILILLIKPSGLLGKKTVQKV
ncbi:MAG: branched-chain amino acid ABC transporter permease [Leptolinea sp.]|jgi:branched-chain amino acid transport system permease protein|nr:branched-chain amino acid ABC transporter permease [Leptolinea sp.]